MLKNIYKETSSCQSFFNVVCNEVLKSAGTVKIRGFDTFSKCKSREGVYRVSHGSLLQMSSIRHLYGCYICYFKRYRASHQEPMRRKYTKFQSFRSITILLNLRGTNQNSQANQSGGILKHGNQHRVLWRTTHKFLDCRRWRTRVSIAPDLGQINRINQIIRNL